MKIEEPAIDELGLQRRPHAVEDPELVTTVTNTARELHDLIVERNVKRDAIVNDASFTAHGKRQWLAKLAQDFDRKLDAMTQRHAGAFAHHRRQQAELESWLASRLNRPPVAPDERPLAEQRQKEIRDRLYSLPDAERLNVGLRAALANDLETLRAIENAPSSFPVLVGEPLERVRDTHMQAHYGTQLKRLRDLGTVEAAVRWNEQLGRELAGAAPDPLAHLFPKADAEVDAGADGGMDAA